MWNKNLALRQIGLVSAPLLALIALGGVAHAEGDPNGITQVELTPAHDTWATHDDKTPHGGEPNIKVGIERQACDPADAKNACTKMKPALVCCPAAGDVPAFCAPADACATTAPTWSSFRKFRGYIRFDLASVPKGKVVKGELRMRVGEVKEILGPPAKVVTTRMKKIGLPNAMCAWDEKTLADTNGTTWSSLPQNVASAPGQMWLFDVTKAAADWLNGDTDIKETPIQLNCGFHLHDPDFGNKDNPIERWVLFNSKEGKVPPALVLTIALDGDKDGYFADVDCDDSDPKVNPGAVDTCGDGIDSDCSGKADDEVCDGQDNDCDGQVDEGEGGEPLAPCPAESVCANHTCLSTCKDSCGGPTDRKCEWDATKKVWVIWGCAKAGACFAWKEYEPCNVGQFCQYGSCSSNCVDLCDKAGDKACVKDKLGQWHVAECGNWDNDSCLEQKILQDCDPSASCTAATCGADGCTDACAKVGAVACQGAKALVCSDSDGDGCLDQEAAAECAPNPCAAPGGCQLPGATPPDQDAGGQAADAGEADAGAADTSEPDGTFEDDMAATAADATTAAPDATPQDVAVSDAAGAPVATPTAKKEDDGCSATRTGSNAGDSLIYLMLAAAALLLRRRSATP